MDANKDQDKTVEQLESDVNRLSEITTDNIMRLAALERVLIETGVISEEKYTELINNLQKEMLEAIRLEAERLVKEATGAS